MQEVPRLTQICAPVQKWEYFIIHFGLLHTVYESKQVCGKAEESLRAIPATIDHLEAWIIRLCGIKQGAVRQLLSTSNELSRSLSIRITCSKARSVLFPHQFVLLSN